MKCIHKAPGFELHAQVLDSRVGRTLELYQVFPTAIHPRHHRICQLTLPPQANFRLAKFIEENLI